MIFRGEKLTFKRVIKALWWRAGDLVFQSLFPLWQSLGFHITRNHYYEPVPDTRSLKDELWQCHSELIGIDMNEQRQLKLLSEFSSSFRDEYNQLPLSLDQTTKPYEYFINNGRFGSVDGEILYCMIRLFKPRKIFEIGSGNSTYLAAQALLRNQDDDGRNCELVAFEPNPNSVLKAGFPGLSKLVPIKVQEVPLAEFSKLEENDILFIDSSHVLKIGSDVQFEYLDILPRLNRGVIVHAHDIFLPSEYPKQQVLRGHRFYTEQYLLQAFLVFNDSFEVLWAGSYMHLKHPDKLEEAFRSYQRDERWPGSFWMRKVK